MTMTAAGRCEDQRTMQSRMQRHLTEVRRFRVHCLLQRGLSPAAVARELGCDPACIAVPANR